MNVLINGSSYNVHQGFSIKESLTGQLHSALVSFNYSDLKPNIKRFDIANFNDKKWIVSNINSVWLGNDLYRCSLLLVELTYILENIIVYPCSFTNSSDSLEQQIEKLFYKVEPLKVGQTPRFKLSNSFKTYLNGIPGEDFEYRERMTLREIIDDMISAYGIRTYVEDINADYSEIIIGYIDLNRKSSDIKVIKGNIVAADENASTEVYADEFDVYVQNVQSREKTTLIHDWQTMKPVEIDSLDNSNFRLIIDHPIDELISCKMKFIAAIQFEKPNGDTDRVEECDLILDLTDIFVEQELFDAMPLKGEDGTKGQEDCIPYQRGSNMLGIADTVNRGLFSTTKLVNYLLDNVEDPSRSTIAMEWLERNDIEFTYIDRVENYPANHIALQSRCLFQVEYVPILDFQFRQSKEKIDVNKKITSVINQTDRSVDIDRFSSGVRTLANFTGNPEMTKDVKVANVGDLLELGDKIENNYSLVSKEYFVFKNFVKAHYTFMQNYEANASSRFSRERRLYNIPQENLVDRCILIKDNLLLDTASITSDNDTILKADSLELLIGSINNNNNYIDRVLVKGKSSYEEFPEDTYYSLNFAGKQVGKSLVWQAKTQDNFSVGLSTGKRVIGGREVLLNRYVDNFGEINNLEIKLIDSNIEALSFNNQLAVGYALPLIPQAHLSNYVRVEHSDAIELQIFKDRLETLKIVYQLEAKGSNNIVIGSYFFKYINLLVDKPIMPLRIWVNLEDNYLGTDVERCKGILTASNYVPLVDNGRIYTNYSGLNNVKSWAIGTTDGKLLLAVNNNKQNLNSIYFGLKRN